MASSSAAYCPNSLSMLDMVGGGCGRCVGGSPCTLSIPCIEKLANVRDNNWWTMARFPPSSVVSLLSTRWHPKGADTPTRQKAQYGIISIQSILLLRKQPRRRHRPPSRNIRRQRTLHASSPLQLRRSSPPRPLGPHARRAELRRTARSSVQDRIDGRAVWGQDHEFGSVVALFAREGL